jgi:nucleotide-binding universal stress UspA family protein
MKAVQAPRSILVPVFDGDISESALARGRSMLAGSDARLILLHIVRKPKNGGERSPVRSRVNDAHPLRWRELARAAHPGRVFVEVLEGDPTRIITGEAERFHSDTILLDSPLETPPLTASASAIPSTTPSQEDIC